MRWNDLHSNDEFVKSNFIEHVRQCFIRLFSFNWKFITRCTNPGVSEDSCTPKFWRTIKVLKIRVRANLKLLRSYQIVRTNCGTNLGSNKLILSEWSKF